MLDRSSLATSSALLWALVAGCGQAGAGAPSPRPRPQVVATRAPDDGGVVGQPPGATIGTTTDPVASASPATVSATLDGTPSAPFGGIDDGAVVSLRTASLDPAASSASEPAVVVALHGLGDRPEAFATLFRDLGVSAEFLIPRAPLPWHDGYAWFPIELWHLDSHETAVQIEQASTMVEQALTRWKRRYRWQRAPILVGYSQGGMIAMRLATRPVPPLRRAVVVSGWLPRELLPMQRAHPETPRLVALHGARDHVVPLGPTREGIAALEALGYPFELRVLASTAHRFDEPMRAALRDTLRSVLAEEPSSASR